MSRELANGFHAAHGRPVRALTIAAWAFAVAVAAPDFAGRAAAGPPVAPHATLVRKVAEDFEQNAWLPSQWNSAKGQTSLVNDPAPDLRTGKSLKIDVAFSGGGFEHFTAEPVAPLWIPGDAKSVTLRCKVSDRRYALKVGFVDGWGRDRVDNAYLAWDIVADPSGDWKTATFKVPEAWIRPVRISGISTHNWEARNVKNTIHIQVDDIEIETDLKDVDPQSGTLTTWTPQPGAAASAKTLKECPRTPLVAVEMSSGQESNVFTRSDPEVSIRLQNWTPGELTGKLAGRLLDASGQEVDRFDRTVSRGQLG